MRTMLRLLAGLAFALILPLAPACASINLTVGAGGGTYADINAAMTAACANAAIISGGTLQQDLHLQVQGPTGSNTLWGITTTTAQNLVSGCTFTTGSFTVYIEEVSGQGFRDNPNVLKHALYPNPQYGAFIECNGSINCIQLGSLANVTIRHLQIIHRGAGEPSGFTIATVGWSGPNGGTLLFDSNILITDGVTDHAQGIFIGGATPNTSTPTFIEQNSMLLGNGIDFSGSSDFFAVNCQDTAVICKFYYDTHVQIIVNVDQGYGMSLAPTSTSVVDNVAVFGFGQGTGGESNGNDYNVQNFGGTLSATNNATSLSAFSHSQFAPNGVTGCQPANAFLTTLDYRPAQSSNCLQGLATTAANGITVDMLGKTRTAPYDIGAVAHTSYAASSVATSQHVYAILAGDVLAPDSTNTFTIPEDWNSSVNTFLLIGQGGNGTTGGAQPQGGAGAGSCFTNNTAFTPGNMVGYSVTTSQGGTQQMNGCTANSANISAVGAAGTGGAGGFAGGAFGGYFDGNDGWGGPGSGGAGGLHAAGAAGGKRGTDYQPASGGAADGGGAGAGASANGGAPRDGTAAATSNPGNGSVSQCGTGSFTPPATHGGGGCTSGWNQAGVHTGITSGPGGNGADYTVTHGLHVGSAVGPGGGGGGVGADTFTLGTMAAGNGGSYGGGGAANIWQSTVGQGGPPVIIILNSQTSAPPAQKMFFFQVP